MNEHFDNKSATKEALDKTRAGYKLDREAWLKENAAAIKERNKWIEENGLPFEELKAKPNIIE